MLGDKSCSPAKKTIMVQSFSTSVLESSGAGVCGADISVLLLSGNLLSRVEYVPGRSLDGFLRRSEEATFASRNFAQGTYLCVVIEVAAGLQSNAKPNCAQIFSSV